MGVYHLQMRTRYLLHEYYYSCNDDKANYGDEVGLGVILRRDIQAP
jgi:uncharacterized protein YfeS